MEYVFEFKTKNEKDEEAEEKKTNKVVVDVRDTVNSKMTILETVAVAVLFLMCCIFIIMSFFISLKSISCLIGIVSSILGLVLALLFVNLLGEPRDIRKIKKILEHKEYTILNANKYEFYYTDEEGVYRKIDISYYKNVLHWNKNYIKIKLTNHKIIKYLPK